MILVAGYLLTMLNSLGACQPEGSVMVIEEPDIIRNANVEARTSAHPVVHELVPFEYQLEAAADRFYLEHPDLGVTAVIPAVEYAVPFAARLAERYGVPGATLGAAQLLRDKAMLRVASAAAGVLNPASAHVGGPEEVKAFAAEHGCPIILKPSNRQGSVGTRIVRDASEIDAAWIAATSQDEGKVVPDRGLPMHMLAEEFVAGEEFSVEMLVRDGVNEFANITGKILYPGPQPVELGHVIPGDLPQDVAAEMIAATERVVTATGFRSGVLHCEWIVRDGQPYLVECAGRMPGDGIVDLVKNSWPIDFVPRYAQIMLGQPSEPAPEGPARAGVTWFLHTEAGEVESITGLDEAKSVEHVYFAAVSVKPGDTTRELRNSWDRVGQIFAFAVSVPEALDAAQAAAGKIVIKHK
ncbi:ATP-grasp domain-containing protein [Longispora albida]|uniref:ATP-grasp domain-containing protein n=1 Tax=Longispora albida TaxID=203523 RepID=UPI0003686B3C|nr:ATP-grasp domain-containing protein [Longispora albida]